MNYRLELNTQEPNSNIVFNTIVFDPFKVNIVERYIGKMNFHPKLSYVLFKIRTLDDQIIKTKEGNSRVKIKGDQFETYQRLVRVLNSYDYKNRLINRQEADQEYVHFMLSLVLANYQLN
ncbi:prevent-host-death protein [Chryseobacterium angstadtii]|uniref:Prevent-host-death protein n=1 Tax=Chryseobacterium angstadtii TaxID=558151 RepID=A0A0J7L6V5_9FLAO|nr:hypothetical protein [Chryseobacterium angstadtii]KMQ64790.1 prevent-host-death protein [Chryseobacterium angstadtii]